jgi:hypothetical protein
MKKLEMWPKLGSMPREPKAPLVIEDGTTSCGACGQIFESNKFFSFCPFCGTSIKDAYAPYIPYIPYVPYVNPTTTTSDHIIITATGDTTSNEFTIMQPHTFTMTSGSTNVFVR